MSSIKLLDLNLFLLTCVLTVIQQLLLAVSSYSIAQAGGFLAQGMPENTIIQIIYFYTFAIAAYIFSAFCTYFVAKMQNISWRKYIHRSATLLFNDQSISCEKNKRYLNSWLTMEAKTTIDESCETFINAFSLYLNVILTVVIFGVTIGSDIVFNLMISILVLCVLLFLTKKYIYKLAGLSQQSQLKVMTMVESIWHGSLFGNNKMATSVLNEFDSLSHCYFKNKEKNILVEQIIASTPILLCVFLIVLSLALSKEMSAVHIGAMVALLPRTLQLLGNIHEIGRQNGRILFLMKRLSNLANFYLKLERQNLLSQVSFGKIFVKNIKKSITIDIDIFLRDVFYYKYKMGRFLITGDNGSGKSSILKMIKNNSSSAVMVAPNSEESINYRHSSGQSAIEKIERAVSFSEDIILLDEWDANLDSKNKLILDEKINELSEKYLVIEVRHHV